ncbi:MAG: hypothetical protein H6624_02785 [Bdellovibrionaceae bacterium]|nr:hypothetical protein [Bdellovibrionales bacterium]MCB9083238.1 hypothetical protein [Pseudobdellovibrionaceae bacterium]
MRTVILGWVTLWTSIALLCSCQDSFENLKIKELTSRSQSLTIQKSEGLNVNEADAIWVSAMKPHDPASDTRVVKLHRIQLNLERNYPITSFDLVLQGEEGRAGSGIRTYVIPEGLLMGKTSNGVVNMFLATKDKKVKRIFKETGHEPRGRATPFSYRVIRNGVTYEFIALAYMELNATPTFRVARFLRLGQDFKRVRSYRLAVPGASTAGVYTGTLDPCGSKKQGTCAPRFFGGTSARFFGIDLTQDVPPSPYASGTFVNVNLLEPINRSFASISHPPGGSYGTINNGVYSMASDEFGNLIRAHYPDTNPGNNFVSYDKVNQLVFHSHRSTRLEPDGTLGTQSRSLITVYKRECFSSDPKCSPIVSTQAKSRLFRDVGEQLGPTSDLGNGCVAVLSFKRPGEEGGNTWFTKVYKACIRDSADLDRGLTVSLLGEVEGAAYMYNDFTGATLFDRPVYILFDFAEKGFVGLGGVKYHWTPKVGFATTPVGLISSFRCYSAGQKPPGDAGFTRFDLGKGIQMHPLPNCKGNGVTQVELKLERDPNSTVRFTRFQNLSITGDRL